MHVLVIIENMENMHGEKLKKKIICPVSLCNWLTINAAVIGNNFNSVVILQPTNQLSETDRNTRRVYISVSQPL